MGMLSELLHFRVVDGQGKKTAFADLAVSPLDTDYPVVTHLIYRENHRSEGVLPWKNVKAIDRAHREIKVESYDQAQTMDNIGQAVRLRHNVLDALIINLQNRRVTRANDLWLAEDAGELRLSAADTGARAILRRLTRWRFRGIDRRTLYDWKYIEFLRGDPQAVRAGAEYHHRIVRLPPGEIAHLTAAMPYLHAAELLELLPEQLAADTLEVMSPERQLQVFEELDEKRAVNLLKLMAPDLAADLVGHLNTRQARRYLNQLPKEAGGRIVELLRYPENTVGGIMANDMVTVSPNLKVSEARDTLREKLKEPDFVYFLYVVEDGSPRRLKGVVTLRQFLVAEDDQTLEEIMNPYLITLSPWDSPQQAAYRLLNSQLAALPVVGAEGELLGTVTIDAAVAQVAPRSWRTQAPRVFS
ncbi:MAG TPA: CBS domain-containing protein [Anaerolineales bacterium]|nr:CBS domain-containing protein [Anaerolineales bacterium]